MARKKRFGVSLPCDLADKLGELASMLGTNRSVIVREAVKEYIHDHAHYMYPHVCSGIIVVTGSVNHGELFKVLEEYKDVIHSFNHIHLGGRCVELLFVNGFSSRIRELHKTIMSIPGCVARYISIHY